MTVNVNKGFTENYFNSDKELSKNKPASLPDTLSSHKEGFSSPIHKLQKTEKTPNLSNYRFPENFSLKVNEQVYDLSNIEIDLSEIQKGGIGRCCIASQVMANGMHAIGHGNGVYNLPFCIEKKYDGGFIFISPENKICKNEDIKNIIESAIVNGFSYINIALDIDGHASLVSLKLNEQEAILKFYDSLSPKEFEYADRYTNELISSVQSLLPKAVQLKPGHETLHLLYQGGVQSTGCGYYTIYTAALLKDGEDLKKLTVDSPPIFTPADDPKIRAELALRTLLSYGIENAKKEINQLRTFGKIEHVFQKLGADPLNSLINSIYKKSNAYLFKFPHDFKVVIKGKAIDVGGLEVDLSNLFVRGFGVLASQLLANGMEAIESSPEVFNFPVCIEGLINVPNEHQKLQLISISNHVVEVAEVRSKIEQSILSGHTILNIPLNVDGHISLACVTISNEKAFLKFYESLPEEKLRYDIRYSPQLINFIETILPNTLRLEKSFEVIPLLREGEASGGYYTLYAAHLLKDKKEIGLLSAADQSLPLLNEAQDKQIRAELVIRTLLSYGINEAKETLENVQLFGKVEHIFQSLGETYLAVCNDLENKFSPA